MKKVVKAYCVARLRKGLRTWFGNAYEPWANGFQYAQFFFDKKKAEAVIKYEADNEASYKRTNPKWEESKYELHSVELKLLD